MLNYIKFNEEIELTHKMTDETNETNLRNLKMLIRDNFYLDDDSQSLVLDCIDNPPYHAMWQRNMNSHNRLFIPIDLNEDSDDSYEAYKRLLSEHSEIITWQDYLDLSQYVVWTSGKFKGMKLFKYLKKKGIQEEKLTELSTTRNTSTKWLVVSKNPVDWLFMSTNQSFSSCMSLQSDYSGAFYMGLPHFMCDPHLFLVFVTTGKLRTYSTHNKQFKHFRKINRSLCVFTDDNKLAVVRYYPNKSIPYPNTLIKASIPAIDISNEWNTWRSHNTPDTPRLHFANGYDCSPYFDCGVHTDYQTMNKKYINTGAAGSNMDLNYNGGFEYLTSIEELTTDTDYCCRCDDRISENDTHFWNDERYCYDCLTDITCECAHCGDREHQDYISYSEIDDEHYCEYCRDNYLNYCNDCGEYFSSQYNTAIHVDNNTYCENCAEDNTTVCNDCGETFENDDVNEEGLCYHCQDAFINSELDTLIDTLIGESA